MILSSAIITLLLLKQNVVHPYIITVVPVSNTWNHHRRRLSRDLYSPTWSSSSSSQSRSSSSSYLSPLLATSTSKTSVSSSSNNNNNNQIILQSDTTVAKQLLNAFTSLDAKDQYDAVLTGICAKILDRTSSNSDSSSSDSVSIQDAISLLKEMNTRKIIASPRSTMALIDVVSTTTSSKQQRSGENDSSTLLVQDVMSLCIQNTIIQNYGQQVRNIILYPIRSDSKITCPDGKVRTRQQRIELSIDDNNSIPIDDRVVEVSSAMTAVGIAVSCEITNLFPDGTLIHDNISPEANILISLGILIGVIDNFYDVLQKSIQFLVNLVGNSNEQLKDTVNKANLPAKKQLPGQLGQGIYTGTIVRGLTRLLTMDPEREAKCEASALYIAYILGLPCYPYQSNAYEASILTIQSSSTNKNTDTSTSNLSSLLTQSGIQRMVMWLLAPVAIENMNYPQLIISDPREASSYLERIKEYYIKNNKNDSTNINDILFWIENVNDKNDFLQWCYLEVNDLLRTNNKIITEISQRLIGGAATVGDCIAVIEQHWDNQQTTN